MYFIAHRIFETSLDTSDEYILNVDADRLPAVGEIVDGLYGEPLAVERIEWRGLNDKNYVSLEIIPLTAHLFFATKKYIPKKQKVRLVYVGKKMSIHEEGELSEHRLKYDYAPGKQFTTLDFGAEFPLIRNVYVHSRVHDFLDNYTTIEFRDIEEVSVDDIQH